MKLATLTLISVLAISVAAPAVAFARPPSHCAENSGFNSCNGNTKIVIGRTGRGDKSNSRKSGSHITTPARIIACNKSTVANLRAAGDPASASDATACGFAIAECRATHSNGDSEGAIELVQQADGRWYANQTVCIRPARPAITAADVRARAVRLIPSAAVGLAPHGSTLVNIETVMWVDAPRTQTLAPVRILGQRVVITLHLSRVTWHFGDGHSATSSGPGKRYSERNDPCTTRQCPGYFGHTYRRPGRVHVNATAVWTARFTVNDGNPIAIPGTVAGPAADAPITIKQARSVLVPNP